MEGGKENSKLERSFSKKFQNNGVNDYLSKKDVEHITNLVLEKSNKMDYIVTENNSENIKKDLSYFVTENDFKENGKEKKKYLNLDYSNDKEILDIYRKNTNKDAIKYLMEAGHDIKNEYQLYKNVNESSANLNLKKNYRKTDKNLLTKTLADSVLDRSVANNVLERSLAA